LNSNYIEDIIEIEEKIWCASYGGGVLIIDKNKEKIQQLTNVEGLLNNIIVKLERDKYGNVWCLCKGEGVTLFSTDLRKTKSFLSIHRIPSFNFSSILITEDEVWIGNYDDKEAIKYDIKTENPITTDKSFDKINIQPSNEINDIQEIRDSIWFATNKGIGIRGKDGKFRIIDKGLPTDTIIVIIEYKNKIWIATSRGIFREKGENWEFVGLAGCRIYEFKKKNGKLYVCTNIGVKEWDGSKFRDTGLNESIKSVVVEKEVLWGGTEWNGVVKYSNGERKYYTIPGPVNNNLYTLALDLDGHLWVVPQVPFGNGFHINKLYFKNGWKLEVHNQNNKWGISGGGISEVLVDSKNNKWFLIFDWDDTIGVVKLFPNGSFKRIKIEGGGNANVVPGGCVDKEDNVWIGCWDGAIRRIRGEKVDSIIRDESIVLPRVVKCDEEGNIWMGSESGIVIFKKDGTIKHLEEVTPAKVTFIKHREGKVTWIGTMQGLYKFKNEKKVLFYSTSQEELGGSPIDLEILDTTMWVSTAGGGVVVFQNENITSRLTEKDGLISDIVREIELMGDSVLWIATRYGLSMMRLKTPSQNGIELKELKIYPNPFVIEEHKEGVRFKTNLKLDKGEIIIYTLSGKLVRKINLKEEAPLWNGEDIMGKKVGTGIYVVVVKIGKKYIKGKVAVIR
jgi:ligand-binding sensor domain-containing protein